MSKIVPVKIGDRWVFRTERSGKNIEPIRSNPESGIYVVYTYKNGVTTFAGFHRLDHRMTVDEAKIYCMATDRLFKAVADEYWEAHMIMQMVALSGG